MVQGEREDFLEEALAAQAAGRLSEAMEILFSGLSKQPENHLARLNLARVFYEQGFIPFAQRELVELRDQLPRNAAIQKLLERIAPELVARQEDSAAPQATASVPAKTIAAAEFNLDDLGED